MRTFAGHDGGLIKGAFSRDDRYVLTLQGEHRYDPKTGARIIPTADGVVKVWDANGGREVAAFRGHAGPIWWMAIGPDNDSVLTVGQDKVVKRWSVKTGREVGVFCRLPDGESTLAFSPDGRRVLITGMVVGAGVWNYPEGTLAYNLEGQDGRSYWAAFNRDGSRIVSSEVQSKKLRIWDARYRNELIEIGLGPNQFPDRCGFENNSKRVFFTTYTGQLWVCDATPVSREYRPKAAANPGR